MVQIVILIVKFIPLIKNEISTPSDFKESEVFKIWVNGPPDTILIVFGAIKHTFI